jgi:serine/threonine protein kinase
VNLFEMSSELSDNMAELPCDKPTVPSGQISHDTMKLFRLDRQLGSGSYGSVHQATYLPNGDQCVIKIIPKTKSDSRSMALHEAHVGMAVSSNNLCKTFAYSEDAVNVYIIMEHIKGMDLHDFILSKPKIFQTHEIVFWFVVWNILNGIKDLHDAGYVHFDIKPENILIGVSEDRKQITSVKIVDFGLCLHNSEIQGYSAGTFDYLAPEIVKNQNRDARIDIWSLGITMHAMFMIRIPPQIASKNPDNQLRRLEIIRNLSSLRTDEVFNPFKAISTNPKYARIQEFIISCLTVDPSSRPTSHQLLEKIDVIFPKEDI